MNTLLDDYEPGETTENLTPGLLRTARRTRGTRGCNRRIRQKNPTKISSRAHYPIDQQEEFGKTVAAQIGFNFDNGRLDITHPSILQWHWTGRHAPDHAV